MGIFLDIDALGKVFFESVCFTLFVLKVPTYNIALRQETNIRFMRYVRQSLTLHLTIEA